MIELKQAAMILFGIEVEERLSIGESFASDVLRFKAKGRHWVIKRPFSVEKARREANWLTVFEAFAFTPKLEAFQEHDGAGYLLMSSLPGLPINRLSELSEPTLHEIGKALSQLHSIPADSFDGLPSWSALLEANARRYLDELKGPQHELGSIGLEIFLENLKHVPVAETASAVHFDFREGNILVNEGQFTGIIDFESTRGGHPSMDFFKLVEGKSAAELNAVECIKAGYGDTPWLQKIDEILKFYKIYHGLGGLMWCARHREVNTDFYHYNMNLLKQGIQAYS